MEKAMQSTALFMMNEWCEAHGVDTCMTTVVKKGYSREIHSYRFDLEKIEVTENGSQPTGSPVCHIYYGEGKAPAILPSFETREEYKNVSWKDTAYKKAKEQK